MEMLHLTQWEDWRMLTFSNVNYIKHFRKKIICLKYICKTMVLLILDWLFYWTHGKMINKLFSVKWKNRFREGICAYCYTFIPYQLPSLVGQPGHRVPTTRLTQVCLQELTCHVCSWNTRPVILYFNIEITTNHNQSPVAQTLQSPLEHLLSLSERPRSHDHWHCQHDL